MLMNAQYAMWKTLEFLWVYFLILDVSAMHVDGLAYLILILSFERIYDLKHNIYNLINDLLN